MPNVTQQAGHCAGLCHRSRTPTRLHSPTFLSSLVEAERGQYWVSGRWYIWRVPGDRGATEERDTQVKTSHWRNGARQQTGQLGDAFPFLDGEPWPEEGSLQACPRHLQPFSPAQGVGAPQVGGS